jgi:hypothetical protein
MVKEEELGRRATQIRTSSPERGEEVQGQNSLNVSFLSNGHNLMGDVAAPQLSLQTLNAFSGDELYRY